MILKKEMKFQGPESDAMLQKFLNCTSAYDFRKLFSLSFQEIQSLLDNPIYRQYSIAKKRGGKREIKEPMGSLKLVQKLLNYYLQLRYLAVKPKNVHGFTYREKEGSQLANIALNARHHVGKKWVMNVDIKDFFNSISAKQVLATLKSEVFHFPEEISIAIALLCTYKGALPTGAPTSPVLSNFICLEMDAQLSALALQKNWNYSRYADDLTFSSDVFISKESVAEIFAIIALKGFEPNLEKFRIQSKKTRQQVTGITVNEKINVNRKFLKKTRAMIHSLYTEGEQAAANKHFQSMLDVSEKEISTFLNRINGNLLFIKQVLGPENGIFIHLNTKLEMYFS